MTVLLQTTLSHTVTYPLVLPQMQNFLPNLWCRTSASSAASFCSWPLSLTLQRSDLLKLTLFCSFSITTPTSWTLSGWSEASEGKRFNQSPSFSLWKYSSDRQLIKRLKIDFLQDLWVAAAENKEMAQIGVPWGKIALTWRTLEFPKAEWWWNQLSENTGSVLIFLLLPFLHGFWSCFSLSSSSKVSTCTLLLSVG